MPTIFTPGGPVDKIVKLRLSDAHEKITTMLHDKQLRGEITISSAWELAKEIVQEIEDNSETIVTISL